MAETEIAGAPEPELADGWYLIEMLGHRRVVGRCREVEIAGSKMIRVDVPCEPAATQYIAAASLYAITPTTEAVCRKLASNPTPVSRYELLPAPEPSGMPTGDNPYGDEGYDDDDDDASPG